MNREPCESALVGSSIGTSCGVDGIDGTICCKGGVRDVGEVGEESESRARCHNSNYGDFAFVKVSVDFEHHTSYV